MSKNKLVTSLGIMQGRLVPKYKGRYQAHPVNYWKDEFYIAKDLGLNYIEFIVDFEDADLNPLLTNTGINEIKQIIKQTNVGVRSVCADYFMEAPLHHADSVVAAKSKEILILLINNAEKLGIRDIVIPCVDQSSLSDAESVARFVTELTEIIPYAEKSNINLSLETDLAPGPFADLLAKFNSDRVTVNYDTGNSASLGYDPAEEIALYGTKISDIHIKDRVLGGGSVKLGTGDTNFDAFFKALATITYNGPFIMQVYRDDEGIEVFKEQLNWFRNNFCIIAQ